MWVLLLAQLAVLWFVVPHGIGFSWRECDTQAIARNFVLDGFEPLRPRVDWRGDTDGAVECEFPLYQLAIATCLRVFGEVEWPGRLLSLLAMLAASLSLHRLLEQRSGPGGALAGSLVFACTGSVAMLATRVMPDAFSLAFGLAGLVAFARYLAAGRPVSLWLAVGGVALASLQKPLALQLGLLMFAWTAVHSPRRLREPRLWVGFGAVLAVVGAWLVHGRDLYQETGLTFGVVSGGDTKFPGLRHVLEPRIWLSLAWTTAQYGFSVFGALALLVMAARRRFDLRDAALLAMVGAGLLVSLRYSYHAGMGPHYHVFAAVAGAWCVARAWPAAAPRWSWLVLVAAVAAHGAWRVHEERELRLLVNHTPLMDVAASIRKLTAPDDLAIVRAEKPRFDAGWRRANNFEDPRLLYQSHRRGWVLPADGFSVAELERLRDCGARVVCDPTPAKQSADVAKWLDENGELLVQSHGVHVHRLFAAN